MAVSTPHLRSATSADKPRLERFECCVDPLRDFEREVEEFIRQRFLVGPPGSGSRTYTPLVVVEQTRLIAVGAHRLWLESDVFPAAEIVVIAIQRDLQGECLEDGTPLIGFVGNEIVAHALDTHGCDVLSAVVHEHNARSLNAVKRMGLSRQMPVSEGYVRMAGRFRKDS